MKIILILVLLCLMDKASCQVYDYTNQDQWTGVCQTGQRQSPINIKRSRVEGCQPNYTFVLSSRDEEYTQTVQDPHYLMTPYTLSTINITQDGVSKIFNSTEFHFHHTSEHQLDGRKYDLEFHVVYQAEDSTLALFSRLIEVRKGNFSDIFDDWKLDSETPIQQKLPVKLTTPRSVFHYEGSLPFPNVCTEGVLYFIDEEVIRIK
jgi:carbonic anhydrase